MIKTDVLVVGAGPAGSAAALVLARAGVQVRLVDRARFPREKLCGDTLNPGAMSILDRLGVGNAVRERGEAITGMTVSGPGGASVTADYPGGLQGASITRRELDLMLVEAAARAGARVEAGVIVRAPLIGDQRLSGVRIAAGTSDHDAYARIVIAADGRHSKVAFHLGLAKFAAAPKRWAFGAYFIDVDGMTSRGEMHIRPDGYVGLSPLSGGVTNVCIVRELRTSLRAHRLNPEDVIADMVLRDPHLQERFARARQVSDVVSLGPLAVDAKAAGCPGLLLAGDAAGFIDPMTGDGMRFALRGGELAAEAALRELETNEVSHKTLAAHRQREFGGKWRVNRTLRWLAASPRGLSAASAVAARWSSPVRRLIGVAGDCRLAEKAPPPPPPAEEE